MGLFRKFAVRWGLRFAKCASSLSPSTLWFPIWVVVICGSLVIVSSAQGQVAPIDPVLQQAIETRKKTIGQAQEYTYSEHYKSLRPDSNGNTKVQFTDTYDIIFLNGAPYKKHLLHNEKPLSQSEQQREEKKLADVANARLQGQSHRLFHASFQVELPIDQLAVRFNVTPNGSEYLDGRRDLVFTAVPKGSGPDALKVAAHDGVAYEMKLWVDREDHVFTKIEATVIADGMRYERGTLMTYKFQKVNDEAWLPARFSFKGKVRFMMSDVPAEMEQTYFDYKKFNADSKLVTK